MCMQYVYAYVHMSIKWTKEVNQNPVELQYQNICGSRVKNYPSD